MTWINDLFDMIGKIIPSLGWFVVLIVAIWQEHRRCKIFRLLAPQVEQQKQKLEKILASILESIELLEKSSASLQQRLFLPIQIQSIELPLHKLNLMSSQLDQIKEFFSSFPTPINNVNFIKPLQACSVYTRQLWETHQERWMELQFYWRQYLQTRQTLEQSSGTEEWYKHLEKLMETCQNKMAQSLQEYRQTLELNLRNQNQNLRQQIDVLQQEVQIYSRFVISRHWRKFFKN
jgi:hypothetical protein